MMEIAGLLAAGILLVTLIALEVRHAGPKAGQQPGNSAVFRAVNGRIIVGVMWLLFLVLLFPRVLELLT